VARVGPDTRMKASGLSSEVPEEWTNPEDDKTKDKDE
jgi:hypothetical protein